MTEAEEATAAEPAQAQEAAEPAHRLRDLVDPDTDTIILVPGLDGTAELFYRQTPLLSHHFNVVAFPLPDTRGATMTDLVVDLVQLIDEVSPGPVILCGESFGGALSMSVALGHPELVKGLVIVNSFPYLENRFELAVAPRITKAIPWPAMPIIRRFTEWRLHSAHTLAEDLRQFRVRMKGIGRAGYIGRLELLADYDIRDRLDEITAPVLFLAGTDDKLLPSADWARYMGRRVPGSEVGLLEGYGHCCLINHDLDLGEIVHEWWVDRAHRADRAPRARSAPGY